MTGRGYFLPPLPDGPPPPLPPMPPPDPSWAAVGLARAVPACRPVPTSDRGWTHCSCGGLTTPAST